jgi:YggT family protein
VGGARLGSGRFAEARVVTIIFNLLFLLIRFLSYAIFASAIVSTLLSFNVLDSRNRVVWSIADFLYRVTDPVLRPIRAVLPSFGGVDLSPWLALVLLQVVVAPLLFDLEQAIVLGTPEPLIR